MFNLYRQVVRYGGLIANEGYDDRGRWKGGINFAGDIFPKMKNWTANNRATSVGNQLLNNYKKFLLHYEKAWSVVDLGRRVSKPRGDVASVCGRACSVRGQSLCCGGMFLLILSHMHSTWL